MKKIVSLFLALVLCTGILAGVSFAADKPTECTEQQAGVIVTHAGDPTAKYFFDTLTSGVINWAVQGLAGDTTITLTKDIVLEARDATNHFIISTTKDDWYNSNPDDKELIFDLGGNTLSYSGKSYLFRLGRYGFTVKNGTIDYTGDKCAFVIGTSSSQTAIKAATTAYYPVLNLENVHIYNNSTGKFNFVIWNHIFNATINVKDSVLWTAKQPAIMVAKTDQTSLGNYLEYSGDYDVAVNVENSTIATAGSYPINVDDEKVDLDVDALKIKIKDTTLVSGAGAAIDANDATVFDTDGRQPAEQPNWSLFLNNGTTATGTAYVYGVASSAGKLPFTDVAESAWYYTYVRDLYNAKVIAGMTDTTFVPEGTLTYGQALKLVTLAVGESEQAPTDAHWASGYLNLAMGNGWLYDEVNLDGKISRLQFCQIAASAAGIVDQPASNPFTDTQDGSVLALYNAGIINGMTETTFSPDSSLTRAQISKIIFGIIAH